MSGKDLINLCSMVTVIYDHEANLFILTCQQGEETFEVNFTHTGYVHFNHHACQAMWSFAEMPFNTVVWVPGEVTE